MTQLKVFLEMIKFEHSIFALPFAYLGMILARRGAPDVALFVGVTIAMVSFRTMAMGCNRLIDLPIDAENPRTASRALPSKKLSPQFVWAATLVSLFIFLIAAHQLSPLCFKLTPVPIALAWLYPWMKRFTWLSHFILGIILGIAPYGAWLASGREFSWVPGLFTLGVSAWVAGFDIIYALQDLEFDQRRGLHSFPARFGMEKSLVLTRALHVFTVLCWIGAGLLANLGAFYFAGLILISIFLVREHWLVRSFGIGRINEAFFTMNAIVSVAIFVATVVDVSF